MKKILFCDFDGVLNSFNNTTILYRNFLFNKKSIYRDEFTYLFDQRCVRWLNWIIYRTNCQLVISSSWRDMGLDRLKLMWEVRNLPGEVIDTTPYTYDRYIEDLYPMNIDDGIRGYQIQQWIEDNQPDKYCIVDDMDDMLPHQNFVRTNKWVGLDYKTSKQIIKFLND